MLPEGYFASHRRLWRTFGSLLLAAIPFSTQAQAPASGLPPPQAEAKEPAAPYTIELLETRVRIEPDGSGRQETHATIQISSEAAARQFARLAFDYHRGSESLDFPLVRITHPGGGTADILPSAISDQPNPAVADAPAFQDVRRKSVRILGLRPGDRLEYRVVTTVSRAPLAPEFYFSHSFARSAIVSRELLELDVPAGRAIQLRASPSLPAASVEETGEGEAARRIYRWSVSNAAGDGAAGDSEAGDAAEVKVTSFPSWEKLSARLALEFLPGTAAGDPMREKSAELTQGSRSGEEKLQAIYDFVSRKIRTVDLPLGATGFSPRGPETVVSSGYATPEEKVFLLAALAAQAGIPAHPVLMTKADAGKDLLPVPSVFERVLVKAGEEPAARWLDPSAEVAPFGVIHSRLRGKAGLVLVPKLDDPSGLWRTAPLDLPFAARQQVRVDATLGDDGKLTAKVRYSLRGDNELTLRAAFHQTRKERWRELAQVLSAADGFRGEITSITASEPAETRDPFTLEYEISQPKFVDWSKSPVRIPALLPQAGLPDPPSHAAGGAAGSSIELGTPLEVETSSTIHLPSSRASRAAGTTVRAPLGISVTRDYAGFASRYSLLGPPVAAGPGRTLTASRHLSFVLRQIAATRAADYTAFVRAVQNDEAQVFTLERAPAEGKPASPAGKKAPIRRPDKSLP